MKIYKENGENIPAIIVKQNNEAAPDGYTEITDINEVYIYGCRAIDPNISGWYDKKCVRDKLVGMIYSKMGITVPADVEDITKWNLLSIPEKNISAHLFIVGKEEFQYEINNSDRYWIVQAQEY